MKKIYLILPLTSIILTAASCGNVGDSTAATLSIMGKKSDLNKSYMQTVFEKYQKESDVVLDIITFDDSVFEAEAEKAFSSGNAPDILVHFNNADLMHFNAEENFLYLNDEEWVDELTESSLAYCLDSSGNLLGLPFWESSVSGCYYNKTILDSFGLKPAATQAEFDMLCDALTGIGSTPICWPGNGCSWMPQFGLDPVFADDSETLEKLNANSITYSEIPAVNDMVSWIGNGADKGWFGKDYMNIGWDDISKVMGSGDAVMIFIWDTWFYTDFDNSGKYTVDDFALMPVFMNTADSGTYEGGNLNMMMLNKNSANLETAKEFLSFCAAAENYNEAFDGISTVSCFKNQTTNIQSHMVTDAINSIEDNERVSVAVSRIYGYSAEDTVFALNKLLKNETDVRGCIELMDEYRINQAKIQGIKGF